MAYDEELANRIREALSARSGVREVPMFGGLSFMVNERMAVSVMGDGSLLVRADPARAAELLSAEGARPAEMGGGRPMGRGWIAVGDTGFATQEDLDFWIGAALEYNGRTADAPEPGRRKKRTR